MSDRKRGAHAKSKVKSVETKQKTLLDLFPRKSVRSEKQLVDNGEDLRHEPEVLTTTTHTANPGGTVRATNGMGPPNSRPKPLHPLFAERSRVSKAAQIQTVVTEDEITEVSSDEPSLTSLPLSSSHISIDSPEPCSSQPGGSQEDPIILDSSPTRPLSLPSQYKHSHPAIKPPVMLPVPSKNRDAHVVPYPDRMSQHVRGPQQTYSSPHIPYSQRLRPYKITTTPHLLSAMKLEQDTNNAASSTDTMNFLPHTVAGRESYLEEILKEHSRLHPAILRVMNSEALHSSVSPVEHKAWVDKWRPTRAEEVLGNEANAVYLRDWLRALELQFDTGSTLTSQQDQRKNGTRKTTEGAKGNKRPRVVRAVTKHRGRKKRRIDSDDEDDWIVYGDEFEDEDSCAAEISDDIELESSSHLYQKKSHADSVSSASSNHFSSHLTNTILLAGPSGTGKTAAAYACADELGWEVFEVYPGIGKRNGASIENMVGDVGKNHIVRKAQRGGETIRPSSSKGRDAFAALQGKGKNAADEEPQDSHSGDFGFVSRSDNQSGGASTVRQSLILLEEVDILFKEDSNFWPAVTNFIKDCKRPVICTCNDVSLIPTLDLPLQTILTFQACPAPVATSYLQGLCCAEGYSVERESLLELYERTDPSISASVMFVESQVPDLRRTINCLQFQCLTGAPSGRMVRCQAESESSIEDLSDWSWPHSYPSMDAKFQYPVIDHAELISFVDSQLSGFDTSQAFNEFEPTADDEVGHTILCPSVPKTAGGFEFRHYDIASTAMRLSRGVLQRGIKQALTSDANNGFRTRGLFRARVEHQLQMAEGLKNKVPLSMWVMRECVMHMDYGPWIRHIVAEEDMQEALYLQRERTGRMTRNSGGEYVRTMRITEEERKGLASRLT